MGEIKKNTREIIKKVRHHAFFFFLFLTFLRFFPCFLTGFVCPFLRIIFLCFFFRLPPQLLSTRICPHSLVFLTLFYLSISLLTRFLSLSFYMTIFNTAQTIPAKNLQNDAHRLRLLLIFWREALNMEHLRWLSSIMIACFHPEILSGLSTSRSILPSRQGRTSSSRERLLRLAFKGQVTYSIFRLKVVCIVLIISGFWDD